MYIASTLARTALRNLPHMLWGDHPHSVAARLITWTAPIAANVMAMFTNIELRKDAVERNRSEIEKLEHTIEHMEHKLEVLEDHKQAR
jgi:hypothetical protein